MHTGWASAEYWNKTYRDIAKREADRAIGRLNERAGELTKLNRATLIVMAEGNFGGVLAFIDADTQTKVAFSICKQHDGAWYQPGRVFDHVSAMARNELTKRD